MNTLFAQMLIQVKLQILEWWNSKQMVLFLQYILTSAVHQCLTREMQLIIVIVLLSLPPAVAAIVQSTLGLYTTYSVNQKNPP